MRNRPQRHHRTNEKPVPLPPEPSVEPEEAAVEPQERARLRNMQALERLKDKVQSVSEELEKVRRENTALAERLKTLEANPLIDLDGGTVITFEDDREAVKKQVQGFIEAIDRYLAREDSQEGA